MELKLRLQRMLQILEGAERNGGLADIERDILLSELRDAYAELKYSEVEELKSKVVPTETLSDSMEDEEENEVEVELIFDDKEDEVESEELSVESEIEAPIETPAEAETSTEIETSTVTVEEPAEEIVAVEEKAEEPAAVEDHSTLHAPHSTPKRSALLSLYEDAPTPVLGEQFHESPSVADTIACPKGVAESTPVVSLREAIGLADKFMFIRELFGGDADAYEQAVEMLDKQSSFDDCIIYISENYTWSPNAEGTKMMMELLQRKYNA